MPRCPVSLQFAVCSLQFAFCRTSFCVCGIKLKFMRHFAAWNVCTTRCGLRLPLCLYIFFVVSFPIFRCFVFAFCSLFFLFCFFAEAVRASGVDRPTNCWTGWLAPGKVSKNICKTVCCLPCKWFLGHAPHTTDHNASPRLGPARPFRPTSFSQLICRLFKIVTQKPLLARQLPIRLLQ